MRHHGPCGTAPEEMIGHTRTVLDSLDSQFWQTLEAMSRDRMPDWLRFEWWHNKYYLRTADNDGTREQIGLRGESEIPFDRELFHPSTGRFALSDAPIAYFSRDFATNCLETIAQFREGPLGLGDLLPYLQGKVDPDPRTYGYPLAFQIDEAALILDLTDGGSPLISALQIGWDGYYVDDVLMSSSPDVYEATHVISDACLGRGYDGIAYRSVRVPELQMSTILILPDQNLVVFDRNKIHKRRH